MAAMPAAFADRIGSNRFDRAAGMAPAARGAGWALTGTTEPPAVTMPDKAKGIARRVDGGLSLKQAMGLFAPGLAIIGV